MVSEADDDQTEQDPTEHDPAGRSDTPSPNESLPPDAESSEQDLQAVGEIDLPGIEADLDGVQAALSRLADGTYWTDEVTGEPIPADVLAADPLARRA